MGFKVKGIGAICAAAAIAVAVGFSAGCAKKDAVGKVVATVNGEEIRVSDMRESMGFRGSGATAAALSLERKKQILDRICLSYLLAQDARSRGLDNTPEFKEAFRKGASTALMIGLLRTEVAEKVKVDPKEIDAEAGKLRAADNSVSADDAYLRANRAIQEQRVRKLQDEIVATAKKEIPVSIDNAVLLKILAGEKIPDNVAWATVGGKPVVAAEAREALQNVPNPAMTRMALDQELTGQVLSAYATKAGIPGTPGHKAAQEEFRRYLLVNLLAEKVILGNAAVTDEEVRQAYKEHEAMLRQKDGKLVPLEKVKDQLKGFLLQNKRRQLIEEYAGKLKGKAKITIDEAALKEV